MFSQEDLDRLEQLLNQWKNNDKEQKNAKTSSESPENEGLSLNPSQLLVIAGLVFGVFSVNSVVINKEQTVDIVLSGSLKRSTQFEKVMKQLGKLPFDQVMKAIMG